MVVVVEVVGAGAAEAAAAASAAVGPFSTSHLQHQNCICSSQNVGGTRPIT